MYNVDDFICPHCKESAYFEYGSKLRLKRVAETGWFIYTSWLFVTKTEYVYKRQATGNHAEQYIYKRPPRRAMCLNCNEFIEFPDYRNKQWKNPLKCVKRAFARAPVTKRVRAAVQELIPNRKENR